MSDAVITKWLYTCDVSPEEEPDLTTAYLLGKADRFEGMTNGEVIESIYPNASIHYHKGDELVDDYVSVNIKDCDTQQDYSMTWWDSPYKKGGEE